MLLLLGYVTQVWANIKDVVGAFSVFLVYDLRLQKKNCIYMHLLHI